MVDGVLDLEFNIIRGTVKVEFDDDVIDESAVKKFIEQTGLRVLSGEADGEPGIWDRRGRHILTFSGGLLIVTGWILSVFSFSPALFIPFFITGILVGGYYIFRKGFSAILSGSADMNFLMSVAVLGAAVIGEWLERK